MAICKNCGEEYSDKRKSLGYNICLDCGEHQAIIRKKIKSKRTAPMYNKGAYGYITEGDSLKSLGRKV